MNDEYLKWIKKQHETNQFNCFIESNETKCNSIYLNHEFWTSYNISKLKYNNVNLFCDIFDVILKYPGVENIGLILGKIYER